MKHDCCKIAVSAATAVAIGYTLCALFVHMNPQGALNMAAQMMHLTSSAPFAPYIPYLQVTASNYVSGVAQAFIYAFGIVWLACCLHHCFFGKKGR